MNPNSLKNLHPIKPGEIRNPKGRPPAPDCLLDCIKAELAKKAPNGLTNEQNIAARLVEMASLGSGKAIDLLLSYLHSKPRQNIDVTSKDQVITEVEVRLNATEQS